MYTLTKADVHAIATIDMQACKGNANIGDGSVSPTLCKPSGSDVHAVAFHPTQDPISSDDGTTHCIGTGSSQGCATVAVAHGSQSAVPVSDSLVRGNNQYSGFPTEVVSTSAMTVRRLTPRECERLQAFPDDYTMIPWRGKSAADCPDGPRYKALGNSMAVNCMEWIGERIAAWEKRDDR
jgi:DNA (cytosine-5)-methyltransferase 1